MIIRSISDLLNVHFSNVGRRVAESCPAVPCHFAGWLQGDYPNTFFFEPVSAGIFMICCYLLRIKNAQLS